MGGNVCFSKDPQQHRAMFHKLHIKQIHRPIFWIFTENIVLNPSYLLKSSLLYKVQKRNLDNRFSNLFLYFNLKQMISSLPSMVFIQKKNILYKKPAILNHFSNVFKCVLTYENRRCNLEIPHYLTVLLSMLLNKSPCTLCL